MTKSVTTVLQEIKFDFVISSDEYFGVPWLRSIRKQ